MKTLLCLAVFVVCAYAAPKISKDDLHFLANLKWTDLPRDLRNHILAGRKHRVGGDSSHWCCANEQPVQSVQKTKINIEYSLIHTKIKIGYTKCGFLSTGSCSLYEVRYKAVPSYHVGVYEVPNKDACPDHHVKCCVGYVLLAGDNCIDLATAGTHLETLKELMAAGLIGRK